MKRTLHEDSSDEFIQENRMTVVSDPTLTLLGLLSELKCVVCDILFEENEWVSVFCFSMSCTAINSELHCLLRDISLSKRRSAAEIGARGYKTIMVWLEDNYRISYLDIETVFWNAVCYGQHNILDSLSIYMTNHDDDKIIVSYLDNSVSIEMSEFVSELALSYDVQSISRFTTFLNPSYKNHYIKEVILQETSGVFCNFKEERPVLEGGWGCGAYSTIYTHLTSLFDTNHPDELTDFFDMVHRYDNGHIHEYLLSSLNSHGVCVYRKYLEIHAELPQKILHNYKFADILMENLTTIIPVTYYTLALSFIMGNINAVRYCRKYLQDNRNLSIILPSSTIITHIFRFLECIRKLETRRDPDIISGMNEVHLYEFLNEIWTSVYDAILPYIDRILNIITVFDIEWGSALLIEHHRRGNNISSYLIGYCSNSDTWETFASFIEFLYANDRLQHSFDLTIFIAVKLSPIPSAIIELYPGEHYAEWLKRSYIPLLRRWYGSSVKLSFLHAWSRMVSDHYYLHARHILVAEGITE